MNVTLDLVLLIAAFVCFVIGALVPTYQRANLTSAGLALWVLTAIV
jgi:hypothetical protein